METMYDRLGDLLNETLEAGHVKFVKPPVENKEDENRKPQKIPGQVRKKNIRGTFLRNAEKIRVIKRWLLLNLYLS